MDTIGLWATDVTECSFVRASLQRASFGAWYEGRGNAFRDVDFSRARLTSMGTSAAVYENCRFDHARLNGVNFWQSSLIRCSFRGELRDVIFDGRDLGEPKPPNPMLDVDMSGVIFNGCDFRGIDFSRVKLPDDPDLILLTDKNFLKRAVKAVPADGSLLSRAVAAVLDVYRRQMEMSRAGSTLANLRDFGPGKETAAQCFRTAGWQPGQLAGA